MRQLSKIESALQLLGCILMVIGAVCYVFMWQRPLMSWIFLIGTTLFAITQIRQTYQGTELTIKRLRKIQIIADLLFVLSGILMLDSTYMLSLPLFDNGQSGYLTYLNYVYNKWVPLLLIAGVLEIYTSHRINYELNKTKK